MVVPDQNTSPDKKLATTSIVRKLKGLLAMSRGGDSEAELAAAKAQELMERYAIDQALLRDEGADKSLGDIVTQVKVIEFPIQGRSDRWIIDLVIAVSKANGVFPLTHRGSHMSATGYELDVATVTEITQYLYTEVLAKVEIERGRHKLLHGFLPGTTYLNNFKHGVVEALGQRLWDAKESARRAARDAAKFAEVSEAYEEAILMAQQGSPERLLELDALVQTSSTSFALVRIEKAIEDVDHRREYVEQWAQKNLRFHSGRKVHAVQRNQAARLAGKVAGETIPLSPNTRRIGQTDSRTLTPDDIPSLNKGDRIELSIDEGDGERTYLGTILFTDAEHREWIVSKGSSTNPIGDYERDVILGVEARGPHGDSEFILTVRMDEVNGMDWWDDIIVGADSIKKIRCS